MSRAITVADLISRIRVRADAHSTDRPTSTELIAKINGIYGKYRDMLSDASPEFETSTHTFSTVAGTRVYQAIVGEVPVNVLHLQRLYITTSTGVMIRATRFEPRECDIVSNTKYSWNMVWPRYTTYGDTSGNFWIEFETAPDAVYTVTLKYLRPAPILTATTDTIDGINGYESWLVDMVAKQILEEEESDASHLLKDISATEQAIAKFASKNRDLQDPPKIQNVRRSTRSRVAGQYLYPR